MVGFNFVFMVWFCLKGRIPTPHWRSDNKQRLSEEFFTSQNYKLNSKQTNLSLEKLRISLFFFFSYEVERLGHRHKAFDSSMKNFLLIDTKRFCSLVKKREGLRFCVSQKRERMWPQNSPLVFVFSKSLFSNTDRCFVCLFVCLFVYARARKHA